MSLFKPFMGNRTNLDAVAKHSGYAYFCVDDGSFHIDYVDAEGNLQRKQINDAIIKRLEALEKIINDSPTIDDIAGFGTLDAGAILDTVPSDVTVIDSGVII